MALPRPDRARNPWQPSDMAQAVLRVHAGEGLQQVATDVGRPVDELVEAVDRLTDPKDVVTRLVALAAEYGYTARAEFPFDFADVPGKTYRPDCVWFTGEPDQSRAVAIFEVDKDVSPKHLAGGIGWANVVALSLARRLRFFVLTPRRSAGVPTRTLELFRKYLADRWALEAIPVAGFSPEVIREQIVVMMDDMNLRQRNSTEKGAADA